MRGINLPNKYSRHFVTLAGINNSIMVVGWFSLFGWFGFVTITSTSTAAKIATTTIDYFSSLLLGGLWPIDCLPSKWDNQFIVQNSIGQFGGNYKSLE